MTHAVIIGGGIAGAVTAVALHKAGIGSTVYEAYPTLADDVGAFLTLGVNGMDALAAVGLDGAVAAAGEPARRIEVYDADGAKVGEGPLTGADSHDLVPRTFLRSALYRVLLDEAERRGVRVERGRRLVDATTSDGQVHAVFADGSHAHGDLLVGADGVWSVTRGLLDADAPAPRYTGQHIVYGFSTVAPVAVPADTYRMVRGRRAFFGVIGGPRGGLWWFARVPAPELTKTELADMTTQWWQDRLVGVFGDDGGPAVEVVAATDRIVGHNDHDIATVPLWHRGRMTIAGDAAHAASPSAGQGASMAIEDSVVLAKCLRDVPGVPRAFATYEALRRPRVERLVEAAAALSSRKPQQEPRKRSQGDGDWIRDHHIDWDSPVEPD
ncbi:FAD-dependent monooxygenase [Pseudonocardia alaniniphila]|uniref:FAD-dependent monooxygenase n=1 Tax=Pseudonocardia alaniniphila TaxID=75291 RepID=A0ABS9T8I6_9PSEU|nr:FAD-dependent monooxygenase [Pseudonocardia alaniniphila]MCH6164851.1 FAD-dependent monooxygenase [Pseudonocardia alaniniphila]